MEQQTLLKNLKLIEKQTRFKKILRDKIGHSMYENMYRQTLTATVFDFPVADMDKELVCVAWALSMRREEFEGQTLQKMEQAANQVSEQREADLLLRRQAAAVQICSGLLTAYPLLEADQSRDDYIDAISTMAQNLANSILER